MTIMEPGAVTESVEIASAKRTYRSALEHVQETLAAEAPATGALHQAVQDALKTRRDLEAVTGDSPVDYAGAVGLEFPEAAHVVNAANQAAAEAAAPPEPVRTVADESDGPAEQADPVEQTEPEDEAPEEPATPDESVREDDADFAGAAPV